MALLLILMLLPSLALASVSARLNKTQVYVGDSVTLEIAIAGSQSASPDLTPLRKDFEILGTGSGSQVQIINGVRSERQTWSIRLRPMLKGKVTIPPVQVGNEQTSALSLVVNDIPTAGGSQGSDVFLEAEVAEPSVYVQQQIRLTTRLYHRWPLLGGEWSEPKMSDAVVERLGEDKRYQSTRNGRIYSVIERNYAVFPERSGELKIPFTRFAGEIEIPGKTQPSRPRGDPALEQFFGYDPFANDFFDRSPFSRRAGKSVRALSPELTITVKPIPPQLASGQWLPAESVSLKDSWQQSLPDFSGGQPVTRVIELEAKGLAASQIPALTFAEQPGIGIYAEPPVTSTRTDGEWVYARSSQTVTYVPKSNGLVTLPEVRVGWWNTRTDRSDETVLPRWNVNIEGVQASGQPEEGSAAAEPLESQNVVENASESGVSDEPVAGLWTLYKPVLIGATVGILALIAFAFWIGRRTTRKTAGIAAAGPDKGWPEAKSPAHFDPLGDVQRACDSNHATAACTAVLDWASHTWPDETFRSLQSVASRMGGEQPALLALDRMLYGGDIGAETWNGAELWQEIQSHLIQTQDNARDTKDETLAPLYPE